MSLVPSDDLRHRPSEPGGRMRDSLFWQFVLPEERLAAQCYLFLSGTGSCGWHFAVWDDDGVRRVFETGFTRLGDGADLDTVDVDGLRLRQPEPLRSASLAIDRPEIFAELTFRGIHDAFSYHGNPDGLPTWFALDRFEQTGRMTGVLRVGDRTITVDRPAHRDHSWGVRDWSAPDSWIWFVAYADDGQCVQGWVWGAEGRRGVAGYVLRDGVPVPIIGIESEPVFDAAGSPVSLTATVVDADAVTTRVRFESSGTLQLPDDRNGILVTESACRTWIDGVPGSGQWENERPQVAHV